jgi:two-component system sensor histidine kinase UhpB
MSELSILLVEDSPDDADLLLLQLAERGLDARWRRVETEEGMRQALAEQAWDVVIADFNLPRFSAEAALAVLQQSACDIPFIVVSGFIGEESTVQLMKAGAHDVVMKDNLARLLPAIERELREAETRRAHRRAEEALRLSEKRLRAITAALGEAVFVVDPDGLLLMMNPEAEQLFGWRESELLGKNVHDIVHRHSPESPPIEREACGSFLSIRQGQRQRVEDDLYLRKDGSMVPVAYVSTPLFEDGRLVGAVTAAQNISERKRARQELLESRRRFQELSAHLQSVREAERTSIARELHDELGQMLTALKMDVSWLQARVVADAAIEGKIGGMTRLIDDTLDWVRQMSAELRPVMLDDLGLRAAVEWLLEGFAERHGIATELQAAQTEFRLEKEQGTAAFRIIQECLTNVARHAAAGKVVVTLVMDDAELHLTVRDDGQGFDPQAAPRRKSFGLLGIRERAAALGGRCQLDSAPAAGTTVSVHLPLRVDDALDALGSLA